VPAGYSRMITAVIILLRATAGSAGRVLGTDVRVQAYAGVMEERSARLEPYARYLGERYPWASTEVLSEASATLASALEAPGVFHRDTFDHQSWERAKITGKRVAEQLGKAWAIAEGR